jgi:hypothetical protein
MDRALAEMLLGHDRAQWSRNGLRYGEQMDLYSGRQRAAGFIEEIAERGNRVTGGASRARAAPTP